jgi:hypothetical protein
MIRETEGAMDEERMAYVAALPADTRGMLFTLSAVIGGMVNQGALNREKMIDYLLGAAADLSADERQSDYALQLQTIVQILEQTQFPDEPGPKSPIR